MHKSKCIKRVQIIGCLGGVHQVHQRGAQQERNQDHQEHAHSDPNILKGPYSEFSKFQKESLNASYTVGF